MTAIWERISRQPARETLTEAYEVRAFRDESERPVSSGAPSGRSRRLPQTTRPPACTQPVPSGYECNARMQGTFTTAAAGVQGGTAYSRRHDSAGREEALSSPGREPGDVMRGIE